MDGKELKFCLSQCFKNQGRKGLTRTELDYLNGKITHDQYLLICYTDYVNSFYKTPYRSRTQKNAIYD